MDNKTVEDLQNKIKDLQVRVVMLEALFWGRVAVADKVKRMYNPTPRLPHEPERSRDYRQI